MTNMPVQQRRMSGVLSYLSLFTSFGTLLCCALPSLMVLRALERRWPLFFRGTVARDAVLAQKVGVHRFRPADWQQPAVRLHDRAAPTKAGGRLPEQWAECLQRRKPVQSCCSVDLHDDLCRRCVQRVHTGCTINALWID